MGETQRVEKPSQGAFTHWGRHKDPGRRLPHRLPFYRVAGEAAHPRPHHYSGTGMHLAHTHYHPGARVDVNNDVSQL